MVKLEVIHFFAIFGCSGVFRVNQKSLKILTINYISYQTKFMLVEVYGG